MIIFNRDYFKMARNICMECSESLDYMPVRNDENIYLKIIIYKVKFSSI